MLGNMDLYKKVYKQAYTVPNAQNIYYFTNTKYNDLGRYLIGPEKYRLRTQTQLCKQYLLDSQYTPFCYNVLV